MGKLKKEKNRIAQSAPADPSVKRLTKPLKGENFYRDAKKVKRLNLLKGGRPVRNANGEIIQAADYQGRLPSGSVGRVAPNRKWFGKGSLG